jgi:RND family efflux transporter MFP subunit
MTNAKNHRRFAGLLFFVSALALSACSSQSTSDEVAVEPGGGAAITAWTDQVEWFFEHPPMVAGEEGGSWGVHATDMATFKPLLEGTLLLRFRSASGEIFEFTAEGPSSPGIFSPEPVLPTAGTYALTMVIRSQVATDTLMVPSIMVYANTASLPPAEADDGGGITFLKEQQWVIPFSIAEAAVRQVRGSVEVPGTIAAPNNGLAEVATPVSGLVLPEHNPMVPAPGQWVRRGQTLAVISPSDREGSYAVQRAEVDRLEAEVARLERLYEAEAVPRKRLDDARRDLGVAGSLLEAIGEGGGQGYRYQLRAPIDGVVSDHRLVLGAQVARGDRLLTVVDPRSVWLRLRVRASLAESLTDITGASFQVEGGNRRYQSRRVVSVGSVIDPESRSITVLLQVDNPDQALKIGMLADARLILGSAVSGTAVPTETIQNEDGIPVAYVQTGGELFERRVLTLGVTDGAWTIVSEGLSPGEHVVTRGAYQVRLASLSTSELATHGHVH